MIEEKEGKGGREEERRGGRRREGEGGEATKLSKVFSVFILLYYFIQFRLG